MKSARLLIAAVALTGWLVLSAIGAGARSSGNPFVGAKLFVDPGSNAARQVAEWQATRPEDAAQLEKIASTSQADWFVGDSGAAFRREVAARTRKIVRAGAMPVFVLYNIPRRDCGAYSAGGAKNGADYKRWISDFAAGVGKRKLAVVIEPDALPGLDCLGPAARSARYSLIRYAVRQIARNPHAAIYLDGGNSAWQSPSLMAKRLRKAGVADARGFALNVSNFQTTAASIAYGNRLARRLGRKHYVVDTSRNGLGPASGEEYWCNPPGRALGQRPTAKTASRLADAYLWIKLPGESDGSCKGGPPSGTWWPEYALGLAERASW
jgi:endoglucanase